MNKERTTVNMDADILERILRMRSQPEFARKSVSALVNMLLAEGLEIMAEEQQK